MSRYEPFALADDVAVTLIPSGQTMVLAKGEMVEVTQALGGSITVQTYTGYLARIAAADFERLGLDHFVAEAAADAADAASEGPFDMERVTEQLMTVFDPEIPINVVDLGLIYECEPHVLDDGSHRIEIKMSMTAPGCGMGDILKEDARSRVSTVPGVSEVDVELVWDPPWTMERMSEVAKLQLGLY